LGGVCRKHARDAYGISVGMLKERDGEVDLGIDRSIRLTFRLKEMGGC